MNTPSQKQGEVDASAKPSKARRFKPLDYVIPRLLYAVAIFFAVYAAKSSHLAAAGAPFSFLDFVSNGGFELPSFLVMIGALLQIHAKGVKRDKKTRKFIRKEYSVLRTDLSKQISGFRTDLSKQIEQSEQRSGMRSAERMNEVKELIRDVLDLLKLYSDFRHGDGKQLNMGEHDQEADGEARR